MFSVIISLHDALKTDIFSIYLKLNTTGMKFCVYSCSEMKCGAR
jgi:hypothetical protein